MSHKCDSRRKIMKRLNCPDTAQHMRLPTSQLAALIAGLVIAIALGNSNSTIAAPKVTQQKETRSSLENKKASNSEQKLDSTTTDKQTDAQAKTLGKSKPNNDDSAKDQPAQGVTFSNPVTTKWKVIAKIRGGSGSARNMIVTMPLPTNWPEQGVTIAEENIPTTIAKVGFRDLDSGVKQLVASIPNIRAREEITISMTFIVSTSQINPPIDTSVFVRPKTSHRAGRPYLGVSPQINFRDSKLRKQVKEVVANQSDLWSEIESIYDWVRDNIEDNTAQPQDIVAVFRAKAGCNEDKVGLFVAMCRAHKIPARMVWVQGTQYAEFMLVDSQANAHWFPCSVGGVRDFGSMSEPRIVLQKGDSIRVPEKEGRQKFVGEFATCQGKSKPSVQFQRQVLSVD